MHRLFHRLNVIHVWQICGPRVMNHHSEHLDRISQDLFLIMFGSSWTYERQKKDTWCLRSLASTENGNQQTTVCCCSAAPLPWSFVYFWYICLSSWNDYSQSMCTYPGIHSKVYWQIGGLSSIHCFLVLNLKISNFEFSPYWKALRTIDDVFVFFKFFASLVLGKTFSESFHNMSPRAPAKQFPQGISMESL